MVAALLCRNSVPHMSALTGKEAGALGFLHSAGVALEAPAGAAGDDEQQSAAGDSSSQPGPAAGPQAGADTQMPGAGDQPQAAADPGTGRQEAAAAQSALPADGGLAAAAAGHPASGAGETADELQPQSAADQAAAQQLMKEEVSRGSTAHQWRPWGIMPRGLACMRNSQVMPVVVMWVAVLYDRPPRQPSRHSCRWQRSQPRSRRRGQSLLQLSMGWWPCHKILTRCGATPLLQWLPCMAFVGSASDSREHRCAQL